MQADFTALPPNVSPPPPYTAPPIRRRLASMLYESMLLFGVLFVSNWIFSTLVEQRHALYLRHALQAWLFLVVTLYFVWFWVRGGQTLAMQTWRIRVVTQEGRHLGYARALLRYLLAWAWFLPGTTIAWATEAQGAMLLLIPSANIVLWAMTAFLDPQRQFLHDRIAGTRLVSVTPPQKPDTRSRNKKS